MSSRSNLAHNPILSMQRATYEKKQRYRKDLADGMSAIAAHREHAHIQPLHDRVCVILDEFKERSVIITPDICKEKPRFGVVESAGPGRWIDDCFYPTQVKPGQRVLLSPGVNVDYDDIVRREGRVVVQEADILGVVS